MTNEKLAQLIEEKRAIMDKILHLENKSRKEKNQKLVGKYFKYRNCYSCPQTDADYWFLYSVFTAIDSDGYLTKLQFEIDKDGQGSFQIHEFSDGPLQGSVEISKAEYQRALKKFKKRVSEL